MRDLISLFATTRHGNRSSSGDHDRRVDEDKAITLRNIPLNGTIWHFLGGEIGSIIALRYSMLPGVLSIHWTAPERTVSSASNGSIALCRAGI